jgi:hypothetical protein
MRNPMELSAPASGLSCNAHSQWFYLNYLIQVFSLLCVVWFSAMSGAAGQASSSARDRTPPKDPSEVSGTVVELAGGQPLSKARIRLHGIDDPAAMILLVSDGDGHFRARAVSPGRYRLTVSRAGFVPQEYGQKDPGSPGAIMTLQPGKKIEGLVFRLIRCGVISGRVLDEDGEPLSSVIVDASQLRYVDGKRNLSTARRAETNDLGEYRLFGLRPGRYIVSAVYPRSSRFADEANDYGSEVEGQSYAKIYYPGTTSATDSVAIDVGPGQEVTALQLPMPKVQVFKVKGNVYSGATQRPEDGANVLLMPRTRGEQWQFLEQQVSVTPPNAAFEIPEVLPGSYILIGFSFREGKFFSTRVPVEVGRGDVERLKLVLTSGRDVSGQIAWDGQPRVEEAQLLVTAEPTDGVFGTGWHAKVAQDNSFLLKGLPEGVYKLSISGQSPDCYIKQAHYGKSDVIKDGLNLTPEESPELGITISSRGSRLDGTVTDEYELPVAGARVVLVPEFTHRSESYLYKWQTTDQYGRFQIRGIAPGGYKVYGWDYVESGAWEDPDFLKPFEQFGQTIMFQEQDQKTVKLLVIKNKKVAVEGKE